MPVLGVIPARLGSTRLPRKPLQPLGGVPLIVRVAERVRSHGIVDQLVVATDSPEVAAVVRSAGFEAALTSSTHPSGTDRTAEVARRPEFVGFEEVLNVQGDEPFVPVAALVGALHQLRLGFAVGTAAAPLDPDRADDPSRVKVAIDQAGRALAFSRTPIPGATNWQHIGVYAYRREVLERLTRAGPVPEERDHRLEQLRAFTLGVSIGVARLDGATAPGVDTESDLREAEAQWNLLQEVTR